MASSSGEPDVAGTAAISASSFRTPAFYRENPTTWFAQLEAQFTLCKITSEATRYLYCFSNLPEDVASAISTEEATYTDLKQQILSVFGKSPLVCLEDALSMDLRGLKPSVAAQRLRQAYTRAGMTVSDDIAKHRILRALPLPLQATLAAHQQSPLAEFLPIADTVFDVAGQPAVGVHKVASNSAAINREPSAERPRRSDSPVGLRPFRPEQRPVVCRSHIYYGKEARSCRPWCQWPGPKPRMDGRSRPSSPAGNRGFAGNQ